MPSSTYRRPTQALAVAVATALAAVVVAGLAQRPASAYAADPRSRTAPPSATPASRTVSPPPGDSPGSTTPSTTTPTPVTPPASPQTPVSPGVSPPPIAPPPAEPGSPGGCGLLDFGCRAVTAFFRAVVSAALNPVFRLLARTVLAAPRVDQMPRVHRLWMTSAWIANTCFILLLVIGAVIVMGHQSLQTSYTAKDLAPRMIVATIASNTNLLVIGPAIDLANALSATLMGPGVDPGKAAETLKGLVVSAMADSGDVFMPLLALVAVIAGLVVLFTFAMRIMLLVLLTAAAPLALACHALPHTEALARLWWRSITGVLAIQVAQSLVLATALRVFFTSDEAAMFGFRTKQAMLDLLLVICLLYILARIPSWVSRLITPGGMSRSPLVRIVRTLAAVLIFRRVSALLGARGGSSGARRPPASPPRPPLPPSTPPPTGPTPRWEQPELPLEPPPPRAEQLQLPLERPGHPAPQPRPTAARWTQLALPGAGARPPRWTQTSLPIRPRYLQTRLPTPPPRTGVQAELPLTFPAPGTPAAGRSPRRLADVAALREAEARTRRRTDPQPGSAAHPDRRNR
jgi:hypothetical protein